MKILLATVALLLAPSLAVAEDKPTQEHPGQHADGRFVPAFQDGKHVGFKVYAIRKGNRLDVLGFQNGDTIEQIDGTSVTTDAGLQALKDKVMTRTGDATIVLKRRGQSVTLTIKA